MYPWVWVDPHTSNPYLAARHSVGPPLH